MAAKRCKLALALCSLLISLGAPHPDLLHAQTLKIVKTKFTTSPGATATQNIDVAAALPTTKIKRYTLTIDVGKLKTAPAGTATISVIAGVLDGASSFDVKVVSQDPSKLLSPAGMTVGPYVGTNSLITVVRGADGLGSVDVRVNAYLEVEP